MALVCLLLGLLKSWGMDGGHLEGQCGGMFDCCLVDVRSVGRFTGRLAFMLSVAMQRDVNHLSY